MCPFSHLWFFPQTTTVRLSLLIKSDCRGHQWLSCSQTQLSLLWAHFTSTFSSIQQSSNSYSGYSPLWPPKSSPNFLPTSPAMPPQLPCSNPSSSIKLQDVILALLFLHSQMISLIPIYLNITVIWWLPNTPRSRLLFWTPDPIFKYLSNIASLMSLWDIKWIRSKCELLIFLQTFPAYHSTPYSSLYQMANDSSKCSN